LNFGHLASILAYVLWGLFPFYWKLLPNVGPLEIICHRIAWSFVALTVGMWWIRESATKNFRVFHRRKVNYGWSLLAALLIGTNWLCFIWSVQHDMVVECALGYFITPLMSVALGVFILGEKLPTIQWLAIALAALGVGYITLRLGKLPVLALILASSFAIYGIVKKKMPLASIPGLWLETTILLMPALGYLATLEWNRSGHFGHDDRTTDLLIVLGGPITTIPLLLFGYGAQRIPLSQLGLLQYIAPSIQFIVGWLAFQEAVPVDRWIGFTCVWLGLLIFAVSVRRPKRPLEDL
jgi:chloramphenicol-sensitive protein RarD